MVTPTDEVSTAADIARAVREGWLPPQVAVQAALGRIARRDAAVGAFQSVRREAALAEADALAARADLAGLILAGVPVAVKDIVPVAGEAMRAGTAARAHSVPERADDVIVKRLREAGAVVIGTTRVPEGCLWPTTDGPDGVTRNPWNPAVTAGGSSGGSAAAVAAGMVPVAHGTDGLGSVRIPAAACGLVGIKPGRGTVGRTAPHHRAWSGMSEHGALATTVGDAALLLAALAGRPDLAVVREAEGGRRVGVSVTPPLAGIGVDDEVTRAVFRLAAALSAAGHTVVRGGPRYPLSTSLALTLRWLAAGAGEQEALADASAGQPRTRMHARLGRVARRGVRPSQAEAWIRRAEDYFAGHDVLLTPVLAAGPLPASGWAERSWAANVAATLTTTGAFTSPWNLAGFPAVAVPAGRHPGTGLPIGAQLVGPPGSEPLLLGLAATIERIRPWPRVAPE